MLHVDSPEILTLNETSFLNAVNTLTERDAEFKQVVEKHGNPPFFAREPGFAPLVHIILEQQVSLASAKSAFDRLNALVAPLTPENFLRLDDAALKSAFFSRQKTAYARNLARAIVEGTLDLDNLKTLPDDNVKIEMNKIKGIGRWTAEVYLLMCLRRADVFPVGDLALVVGVQKLKNLEARLKGDELERYGEIWRPFRAVATRIVWHHYLKEIRPYSGY